MTPSDTSIVIPADLLPSDGRFGSGPSKVRPQAVQHLAERATDFMGTSHRRDTVRDQVGRLRHGLSTLFQLPEDWEIVLGNGGTTVFWDAASFGLIESRAQHLVFGEFSSKFGDVTAAAPHLGDPEIIEAPVGSHPMPVASDVDAYALTHNETSTGVVAQLARPATDGLVLVDATSAAGAVSWNTDDVDCY